MKVYQTKGSALEQRERTYIADGMMGVFVTETKSGTHKMVNIEGLLSGTLDEKKRGLWHCRACGQVCGSDGNERY